MNNIMKQWREHKTKLLTIGTILIFIINFFNPVITATDKIDDEEIEITIEIMGKSYKKMIPKIEYEYLKQDFNTVSNKINKGQSVDDLFNEIYEFLENLQDQAILENKDKLSLLNYFSNKLYFIEELSINSQDGIIYNYACLTAGCILFPTPPLSVNPILTALITLMILYGEEHNLFSSDISPLPSTFEVILMIVIMGSVMLGVINPFPILHCMDMSFIWDYYGYLYTLGLNGFKYCEKWFVAQIFGFTGLKITTKKYGCLFLGVSAFVRMIQFDSDQEPPMNSEI